MNSFVRYLLVLIALFSFNDLYSQDSTIEHNYKVVTLREVVFQNNLDVPAFINRVQEDTSFYKAFKNLRILSYTSLNDIRMMDKKGRTKATLQSRTRQTAQNGCRQMEVFSENVTGNMYESPGEFNYYTAQMYASLFFTKGKICGETNIVGNTDFNLKGKSGLEKHKEQLKMLFFNPGKRIPGIPLMGRKTALFEKDAAKYYDYIIDVGEFKGENCYIFKAVPRADLTSSEKDQIVINEMTTWFNMKDWQIVARNYDLSYRAGVYDFDVHIEVEMTRFKDLIVPKVLRYNGNWDVMLKKREIGIFTATLFDFE